MRKILAAALLAAAALSTPAAAEDGCYGVRGYATACYSGSLTPVLQDHEVCVYTGGTTCDPYYVPLPWVEGEIYDAEVCVGRICRVVPLG